MPYRLICGDCGKEIAAVMAPRCSAGHSSVTVEYPLTGAQGSVSPLFRERSSVRTGMWRYASLLPIGPDVTPVTLGEGATPLLDAKNLARSLGLERIHLKLEATNPTGSFKDRCASVALTKAKEFGVPAVAIASAGNAGASASAYAAQAKLPCWVFVPETTPNERITQILITGARAIRVKGSVNDCSELVGRCAERFGWYPVTTAAEINVYQGEALRTIAFEIVEQLGGAEPDWLVCPVGGGGLLSGLIRGWHEAVDAGVASSVPRPVAVQAAACAPFVRAIDSHMDPDAIIAWEDPAPSVASSIVDPFPMDGARAMRALLQHNGLALAVDDREILAAESMLAHEEGIFVEPASATTVAAVLSLLRNGAMHPQQTVLIVGTGAGFKGLAAAQSLLRPIPTIRPQITEVDKLVSTIKQ